MNHKTDMQAPTEAQIVAAARALSNHHADTCNVNREDNWMIYGDSFRESAEIALRAALASRPDAQVGERYDLLQAAVNCPHEIESNRVVLHYSDKQPGHNALAQLRERLTRAAAPQADERGAFQSRVHPWLLACFGAAIATDVIERNHRFFEEAAELVQACGMTASEAHQLVEYTWSRPVGEKTQEVGGVMVTLAALCLANGLDMHAAGETELARISIPGTMAKIRAKQAAKPKHSPLPEARAAAPQAEAAQGVPEEAARRALAATDSHRIELIRALQKALAYWMPSVFDDRSAHDAYLLVGYEGETEAECWGDRMIASLPRWTPVGETLPAQPGWYLAMLKPDNDWGLMSDTALQVEFGAYNDKPRAFTCFYEYRGDEDITDAVTHWMPMPAAPSPDREQPPYSAPFITDVPQCCGEPGTCNDPCADREQVGGEQVAMYSPATGIGVANSANAVAALHGGIQTASPSRECGERQGAALSDETHAYAGETFSNWWERHCLDASDIDYKSAKYAWESATFAASAPPPIGQCVHAKGIVGDEGGTPCCPVTMTPDAMPSTPAEPVQSPTSGMTLGERIAHVGGRTNAAGYVEFGSPMAVDALIRHTLRDAASAPTLDEERWPSDRDAAIQACALMILGICKTEPHEVWPKRIEGRIRYMLSRLQPQAAEPKGLTDEQRETIRYAVSILDEQHYHKTARDLRALLAKGE